MPWQSIDWNEWKREQPGQNLHWRKCSTMYIQWSCKNCSLASLKYFLYISTLNHRICKDAVSQNEKPLLIKKRPSLKWLGYSWEFLWSAFQVINPCTLHNFGNTEQHIFDVINCHLNLSMPTSSISVIFQALTVC